MTPPSDVEKRRKELLQKMEKLEAVIRSFQADRKIEDWKPWPHQKQALDFLHLGKKTILMQGGNRIGKTVFGVNVVGSVCLGIQPWDGKPTIFPPGPKKVRIIAVDWEHHAREVIVPALYEWLPKGTYKTLKNNVGVEAYWEFPGTESTIEIMTHSQETKIHEGWKGHIVWSDEPLPKDKYTANRRGLIDYSGVFIMTMTALYEPWILDEIALANDPAVGTILEVSMYANPLLKPQDIENFSRGLTEEERAVRVHGQWLQLTGLILKEFKRDIHVVPFSPVPPDWPVIALIDIHLEKPQAIGFYGFDSYDRLFVADEIWSHLSPEEISDAIIRKKQTNAWRMKDVFIDPLAKGDNAYTKNRFHIEDTFSIIERRLIPFGLRLHVASKDKDSGIRNLQKRLKGPNNIPSLFIMDQCQRHIYEIRRWIYDKNGIPTKENDHFMENLYRATLAGVKYSKPGSFSGSLDYKVKGIV